VSKFRPGRSGNPRGRPKGARNVATQFLEEMNAPASGMAISNLEAVIKAQASKAVAGDLRAIRDVLDRMWKLEMERSAASERAIPFNDADREVIAEIHRRLSTPANDTIEVTPGEAAN
jgi:hypothetical protein